MAATLRRPDVGAAARVIHGHFAVRKYAGLYPEARRIVWLREPVARLVSHYHYWRGLPHGGHNLHRRLLEENLSLEAFAALDPMRDCMSRLFLAGSALEDFAFVGRQECFAEDLPHLARTLGWPAMPAGTAVENRGAYAAGELDKAVRRRLQALNPADTALYRRAGELAGRRG